MQGIHERPLWLFAWFCDVEIERENMGCCLLADSLCEPSCRKRSSHLTITSLPLRLSSQLRHMFCVLGISQIAALDLPVPFRMAVRRIPTANNYSGDGVMSVGQLLGRYEFVPPEQFLCFSADHALPRRVPAQLPLAPQNGKLGDVALSPQHAIN
jgi:hypothetical protein